MTRLTRLFPAAAAVLVFTACATAPAPEPTPPTPAPVHLPTPEPPPPVAVPTAPAEAAPAPVPEPVAIDPLRPEVRIDLNDGSARLDLWGRVRQGFAMNELDNELVRKWEQWYASRPDYVQRMTERGGRYLFHILEELAKRDMPTELALLPFIESAYNPEAMSRAQASGMWQFMSGTGKDFDLKQNLFRDDRRAVLNSTRAALDYLQMLHGMFGDWQLALAAYNWGQGNVQRGIARNQKAGLAADYASLRMPDETRNYLPKLQAVKNIVLRPEAFSLALPALQNHPYFLSVPIERDIDVERAAQLARLSVDEFKQLNPQMNKPVILAAGTPQVLLPYDSANAFVRGLIEHSGPLASWTAWVAPKTMKPAEVARLVGMHEAQLREVNRIPAGMLVRTGSTLLVPRDAKRHEDVALHVADHATLALAPDRPPVRHAHAKAATKGARAGGRSGPALVLVKGKPAAPQAVAKAGTRKAAGTRTATRAPAKPVQVAGRATTGKRLNKPAATARTLAKN